MTPSKFAHRFPTASTAHALRSTRSVVGVLLSELMSVLTEVSPVVAASLSTSHVLLMGDSLHVRRIDAMPDAAQVVDFVASRYRPDKRLVDNPVGTQRAPTRSKVGITIPVAGMP